jgi:hypothetical protein
VRFAHAPAARPRPSPAPPMAERQATPAG